MQTIEWDKFFTSQTNRNVLRRFVNGGDKVTAVAVKSLTTWKAKVIAQNLNELGTRKGRDRARKALRRRTVV